MINENLEVKKEDIQALEFDVNQIEDVLKKIRRNLYIVSIICIAYELHDLYFRFQVFETGATGIGFQNGIALEGFDDMIIKTILLVILVIITFRFSWYTGTFIYTKIACYRLQYKLERRDKEALDIYKEYIPQIEHEEERASVTAIGLANHDIKNSSSEKHLSRDYHLTKGILKTYRAVDSIVFPTIIPCAVAIVAFCLQFDKPGGYISFWYISFWSYIHN